MENEITTARKFFDELKTVAEWKFEDFQEDVEKAIDEWKFEDFQEDVEKAIDELLYTDIEEEDIKDIVEDVITDKLYEVFRDAIVAASTDKENKDVREINYTALEWSFLAFERGEKFSTEKDIYDSVKDNVEYARYTLTND